MASPEGEIRSVQLERFLKVIAAQKCAEKGVLSTPGVSRYRGTWPSIAGLSLEFRLPKNVPFGLKFAFWGEKIEKNYCRLFKATVAMWICVRWAFKCLYVKGVNDV
jgi:hypothetical protein